jgi:hypothetical protein
MLVVRTVSMRPFFLNVREQILSPTIKKKSFFMVRQLLVGPGLPIVEASRLYSDKPQLARVHWTSGQPDAQTSTWLHTTLTTDIHAPGGIRIRNPSKRADADPRLRLRNYCDQRRDSIHNADTAESNNVARNYLHFTNKSPLASPYPLRRDCFTKTSVELNQEWNWNNLLHFRE